MRTVSLATLSLVLVGAIVCGGTAFGATIIAIDTDNNLANGIQSESPLGVGTHAVIVALKDLTPANLAGYTVTVNITGGVGNPVTIEDLTGFGLETKRDVDASNGSVALGRAGLTEVAVTEPFGLYRITFTVTGAAPVTLSVAAPSPTITELGNLTQFSIPIDSVEGGTLTGGVTDQLNLPYFPGYTVVKDIELFNETDFAPQVAYELDGWGAPHKIGWTSVADQTPWFNPAYFPGWDIVVDLEITDTNQVGAGNESAYSLDGFGAVHCDPETEFVNQVYFFDQSGLANVATDFEPYFDGGNVVGGWVLDEFGNVWAVGAAPGAGGAAVVVGSLPGRTFDPSDTFAVEPAGDLYARDLAVFGNGAGGYVLDSFGGVTPFGTGANLGALSFGFNIARDIWVNTAGDGVLILDGYGAVHPLGNVNAGEVDAILANSPYFVDLDLARDLEVFQTSAGALTGAYILDGFGAIHLAGAAQYPAQP